MKGQAFFLAEVPPAILSLVNARVAGMTGPVPHWVAGDCLTGKTSSSLRGVE
jgi:hypothetical protein